MLEHAMFEKLPAWSQVAVLAEKGTVLAHRRHKEWAITLYSLNNYFVERWVKQEWDIVGSFHKSASPLAILEPYMETIDLQRFLEV
jgi:hypothetical protein